MHLLQGALEYLQLPFGDKEHDSGATANASFAAHLESRGHLVNQRPVTWF
jgi:hypothetical protein